MDGQNWGVQKGELAIDEAFVMDNSSAPHKIQEHEGVILGTNFGFPLDVAYEKIFIGGKTGSGKSYTSGVFMEELSRHGIQFVCFDALDAHSGLPQLPNVERISPTEEESVNVHKLVYNLQNSNSSLIINMVNLKLETQQEIIGEYCEALLAVDKMGKPIMSFFEECQDFVPQIGRPPSFPPIVRLCKLGRGKGLGATLISQRPAAIHKEALSQVSTYLVHNIINTRDLEALKIQLSFGTDKNTIKNILSSISYASPGEMVCFSPKYFKEEGYIKVGKVDRQRSTEHGGKNIDVQSKLSSETRDVYGSLDGSTDSFSSVMSVSRAEEVVNPFSTMDRPTMPSHHHGAEEDEDDDWEMDEPSFDMEWDPYYGKEDSYSAEPSSPAPQGSSKSVKAITAVGLFSTGVFLLTRGLSRGKSE